METSIPTHLTPPFNTEPIPIPLLIALKVTTKNITTNIGKGSLEVDNTIQMTWNDLQEYTHEQFKELLSIIRMLPEPTYIEIILEVHLSQQSVEAAPDSIKNMIATLYRINQL